MARTRSRWPLWIAAVTVFLPLGALAAPLWRMDPAKSRLEVVVRRAGAFSSALHDHFFIPERWDVQLELDPEGRQLHRLQLEVDPSSLKDHNEELSEKDHAKVEDQVRSPSVLDVERYPQVLFTATRFVVTSAKADAMDGTLTGDLELHGLRRELTFPVHVELSDGTLLATGEVRFPQSAFGIKPYRKALGPIGVQDEVTVTVKLRAVKAKE